MSYKQDIHSSVDKNGLKTLDQWLKWIASVHPQEMALGLDRVKSVAERMGLSKPTCPLVIVGGTNGKGSCVASLEKIYSLQGYRTGAFTSPILFRHNELLRIQGQEVEDQEFCEAYAKIEAARAELILTAFEYHTLAAMEICSRHVLDIWILEVGLGGRLDAVNIMDADVAIVTSIGIDHVDWLGSTRELIGTEKAGIFRSHCPAICGDTEPPNSLAEYARKLSSPFYCQGKEFSFLINKDSWEWRGENSAYAQLPFSQLAVQNISTALMAVEILQTRLPVSEEVIRQAIKTVSIPGRIEIIPGPVTEIHDVSHNPAAVAFLSQRMQQLSCQGKTRAVFSMLGDKDIAGSLREIKMLIDEWVVAPLGVPRAASREQLVQAFQAEGISAVTYFDSVKQAAEVARKVSQENDRLLVFGSFHTVALFKSAH